MRVARPGPSKNELQAGSAGGQPEKSWLRQEEALRVLRAPGDKDSARKDQNLLLALVDATKGVGDKAPSRLGGLAFRRRLHRIRNDIALIDWVRPAHVFETWRHAKLRKGLAALGHRGAQGAARVNQSAHP